MNCPNCSRELQEAAQECAACGLILAKWAAAAARPQPAASVSASSSGASSNSLYILFGLFLAAAGLWRLDDAAPPEPAGSTTSGILPGSYKTVIMDLESELFAEAPTLAALAPKFDRLTQKVLERKDGDSGRVFQEIAMYREGIEKIPDTKEWARRWEEVRDQNFRPAPWFKSLPKPPAEPQP